MPRKDGAALEAAPVAVSPADELAALLRLIGRLGDGRKADMRKAEFEALRREADALGRPDLRVELQHLQVRGDIYLVDR